MRHIKAIQSGSKIFLLILLANLGWATTSYGAQGNVNNKWDLFSFIKVISFFIGSGGGSGAGSYTPPSTPSIARPTAQSTAPCKQYNWVAPEEISYDNPNCRITAGDIARGRQAMREAGREEIRSDISTCRAYRSGCYECPGPAHEQTWKSPSGYTVTLADDKMQKKQNHLHRGIRKVLETIAEKNRKNVVVTSAYRSCYYQASTRQGVSRSQHLRGNAADWQFANESTPSAILAKIGRSTLDSMGYSHIGGIGIYCGLFSHVDTGKKRPWNWCGRRGRKGN